MSTTIFVSLVPISCAGCKAIFGMTEDAKKRYQEDEESFYCPYCRCSQSYGESKARRLEKQLAQEKKRHEMTSNSLAHSRRRSEKLERSRNALKGVVTKTKNRIKNGVCPACNRHFNNLERHMAGQHPDYGNA